jgi:predicted DNA-binding protein
MAISVRMDPLLEKELELTAKRQGITKSQFIIDAVERALGRKNPYELMLSLTAEEERAGYALSAAFTGEEQPYKSGPARRALVKRLKEKHRAGGLG